MAICLHRQPGRSHAPCAVRSRTRPLAEKRNPRPSHSLSVCHPFGRSRRRWIRRLCHGSRHRRAVDTRPAAGPRRPRRSGRSGRDHPLRRHMDRGLESAGQGGCLCPETRRRLPKRGEARAGRRTVRAGTGSAVAGDRRVGTGRRALRRRGCETAGGVHRGTDETDGADHRKTCDASGRRMGRLSARAPAEARRAAFRTQARVRRAAFLHAPQSVVEPRGRAILRLAPAPGRQFIRSGEARRVVGLPRRARRPPALRQPARTASLIRCRPDSLFVRRHRRRT